MKTIELKGSAREIAERSSDQTRTIREIRNNGGVPCVLYGGETNHHFTVKASDLRGLVYTPDIHVVNIDLEGKQFMAILQDIQFHPVSDKILHVDFKEINETNPIVMEVPIKLQGLAKGVKAGGKLQSQMRKLKVRALYTNIPERLVIDVTKLELGKTIKVGEVSFENLDILNAKEAVICAVRLTRAARGLAGTASADSAE